MKRKKSAAQSSHGKQIAGRCRDRRSGGARRDRTDDLLLAKQALSQLSYGPVSDQRTVISNQNPLITDN
jgi:hypothetical protein